MEKSDETTLYVAFNGKYRCLMTYIHKTYLQNAIKKSFIFTFLFTFLILYTFPFLILSENIYIYSTMKVYLYLDSKKYEIKKLGLRRFLARWRHNEMNEISPL